MSEAKTGKHSDVVWQVEMMMVVMMVVMMVLMMVVMMVLNGLKSGKNFMTKYFESPKTVTNFEFVAELQMFVI